jgi:uncharacterized protein
MPVETLLLCGFAFLAGMVDAVAGGGGLLQVPALFALVPGASPATLLGTNKLAAIAGTATATLRYARSVELPWRSLRWAALAAFCAAAAGAVLVTRVPGEIFKPIGVIALTMVAIWTLLRGRLGVSVIKGEPRPLAERVWGGLVGFYDGLLGPGAGSFFTFGFVRWFGRDFLQAAAAAKLLNLASNGGALLLFVMLDSVDYAIALPMMAANIVGGYCGAALAVKGGAIFVRKVFLVVVIGLIAKLLLDLLR